jgi:hypothetical protein
MKALEPLPEQKTMFFRGKSADEVETLVSLYCRDIDYATDVVMYPDGASTWRPHRGTWRIEFMGHNENGYWLTMRLIY